MGRLLIDLESSASKGLQELAEQKDIELDELMKRILEESLRNKIFASLFNLSSLISSMENFLISVK